jgi:limonene-1,2-epoxide hydrolase
MIFAVKPIDIIHKFVNAVNEQDYKTMASCIEPKYERFLNAASNVVGAVVGVNMYDMIDLMPVLQEYTDTETEQSNLVISKINSEKVTGDRAEVQITLTGQSQGEIIKTGKCTVYLKKFDEGWRIQDIKQ